MIDRRAFIHCLGIGISLATPLTAQAQQPEPVRQIGVLELQPSPRLDAFRQGLRELGLIEGRNVILERRSAEGRAERLPALADELVRLKVDVIFSAGTITALAAKQATTSLPIVFAVVADPVGAGLVTSLSRPGGNITGLTTVNVELSGKRLQLLKEALPKLARVATLFNVADRSNVLAEEETRKAAHALGVKLQPLGVRGPDEFERAFASAARGRADALMVQAGALTSVNAKAIVDLAARFRLPSMYGASDFIEAGGLMSYSADFREHFRRAAAYVEKILKGARPADLPVEQPTKFRLVINLKTAKALALTIPQSFLLRADQVIQ